MNDGKQDEQKHGQLPLPQMETTQQIQEAYSVIARWLLASTAVLEVWSVISDLPKINTPDNSLMLDAGTWFLMRVALPPHPEEGSIISFVSDVTFNEEG